MNATTTNLTVALELARALGRIDVYISALSIANPRHIERLADDTLTAIASGTLNARASMAAFEILLCELRHDIRAARTEQTQTEIGLVADVISQDILPALLALR